MPKYELNELTTILNSKPLRRILEEHKKFLQDKVNNCIREENLILAYANLARLDDIDRILKLIEQEITKIQKGDE